MRWDEIDIGIQNLLPRLYHHHSLVASSSLKVANSQPPNDKLYMYRVLLTTDLTTGMCLNKGYIQSILRACSANSSSVSGHFLPPLIHVGVGETPYCTLVTTALHLVEVPSLIPHKVFSYKTQHQLQG